MASDRWQWDLSVKRYRDLTSGQFLAQTTIDQMREDFMARMSQRVDDLATQLVSGDLAVGEWETAMRDVLRGTYGGLYAFGRGGRNAMEDADWGHVGAIVKTQYRYLNDFANDLAGGELTEAQLRVRSAAYIGSSLQAHEHGRIAGYGMPSLSQYPGDGQTACLFQCHCSLRVVEQDDAWHVYWEMGTPQTDHCGDCPKLASAWAPLVISKSERSVIATGASSLPSIA